MRRAIACAAFGAVASLGYQARAEPREDVARADVLFESGKSLRDSGRLSEACADFSESKRLAWGVGVSLYLADCYERLGRIASAWIEFRSAERLAKERSDARADVAGERAKDLEAKLNRMTIEVASTLANEGIQVLRDGEPVAPEEWGLAVPVDPGDHVVESTLPGRATRAWRAHLDATSVMASVRIDFAEEAANSGGTTADGESSKGSAIGPAAAGERTVSDAAATRRGIGVGLLATGAAAVCGGAALAIAAASAPSGAASDSTLQAVSTVSFVAGAATLLSGVVLYLTPAASGGVVVVPAAAAGGGGALVRGVF
jgi:hypothetical protein